MRNLAKWLTNERRAQLPDKLRKKVRRYANRLTQAMKAYLLEKGVIVRKATPHSHLVAFLASVRPVTTNHALIRVGGDSDGGYVLPDDLTGVDACFSPGVATTADFENELTALGIKCFLADYSVASPPIENPLFDFEKKYLGITNDDTFMTLETWLDQKTPSDTELLLQMDIEGSEYPVIFHTNTTTLSRFRIIVIEFHGFDSIFTKEGFKLMKLTFSKLLQHFEVVHIHPNNCCGSASSQGSN